MESATETQQCYDNTRKEFVHSAKVKSLSSSFPRWEALEQSKCLGKPQVMQVSWPPLLFILLPMYYVYMLHNSVTGKHYIGYSSDLKRRIQEHIEGQSLATKNHHGSWQLVYYEAYLSEKSARLRELQLKAHWKWASIIKERVKNDIQTGE